MSRRSNRKFKLHEKRQERQENNWKKKSYHEMGEKGILGHKELANYRLMYSSLNGQREMFPSPAENPTRNDYQKIRVVYNRLERRFF